MAVRRYSSRGITGYGVLGDSFTNEDGNIVISANEFSQEAVSNYYSVNSVTTAQPNLLVSVRWRWSVQIIDADLTQIKQYDNQIGLTQYGRAVMSAYDYICNTEFISFAKMKSALYSAVFRYSDGVELDEIPCDEPQDTDADIPSLQGGWMAYQKEQPTARQIPGTIQNQLNSIISDQAVIFLSTAVLLFRVGVTYEYWIFEYDNDSWLDEGQPPQIIF